MSNKTRKTWRLIIDDAINSAYNMAVDEALLITCQGKKHTELFPTLRFYRWKVPTLSFGYAQGWKKTADIEYCKTHGINIVRRPTGGRAVLHDKELTYSVVGNYEEGFFSSSILETYRNISSALVCGLNKMNVPAQLVNPHITRSSSYQRTNKPCFFSATKYELAYSGKKMVGSAQKRQKDSFLQHGSILLEVDLDKLFYATGARKSDDGENSIIALNQVVKSQVSIEDLIEALIQGFEQYFSIKLILNKLLEKEVKIAERLCREKYSQSWWNFSR